MNTRRVAHVPGLVLALAVGLSTAACSNDDPGNGADSRKSADASTPAHSSPSATGGGAHDEELPATPASWCTDGASGSSGAGKRHRGPLHDDFNGDGYSDVAFPVPYGDLVPRKTLRKGGYVAVAYGSAQGLRTSSRQLFDQDRPGMPGVSEPGDYYGTSVTSADLDRDGYADLIVGSRENGHDEGWGSDGVDNDRPRHYYWQGSLSVIWGSPSGLSGSVTLASDAASHDDVGALVAAGDFDGDGAPDLATEVRGHDVRILSGPFGRDGRPAGGVRDVQGPPLKDPDGPPDAGMSDMATGDVDGDGITDLVSTGNTRNGPKRRSDVVLWKGTHDGLTAGTALSGVHGPQDQGDDVAVGDVNGDGYGDIITNAFFVYISTDDLGSGIQEPKYAKKYNRPHLKSGAVVYLPGGKNGPDVGKMTMLNQDSPGVPGVAHHDETGDEEGGTEYFGSGISVGDIDGDGYADVSVGTPAKDVGAPPGGGGDVVTLRGTADGLTGKDAQVLTASTKGLPSSTAKGSYSIGMATKLVDTDRDGHADLLAGGESDPAGAPRARGSVWVFSSTACGVTPKGSSLIVPSTLGAPDEFRSSFGEDFNS